MLTLLRLGCGVGVPAGGQGLVDEGADDVGPDGFAERVKVPARIGRAIMDGCALGRPVTRPIPDRPRDAGLEAHRAAIVHLDACGEAMFAAEEADDPDEVASPAVGPYCGCTDCDVREILAAAWPILLEDAASIVELAGHTAAANLLRDETARVRQALAIDPDTAHA